MGRFIFLQRNEMSKSRLRGVLTKNQGKCIYTGRTATSADHVPPRCLLADPLPVNLTTVPSCATFNSESALDEQYFLMVLAHIGHHPALAWRLIKGGDVDRALRRRPGLDERIISELGVDDEGRPFFQPDQARVNSVLRKIAAGLFFLRFGEAPGLNAFHPIDLYQMNNPSQMTIDLSYEFEHIESMTVVQWSVFYYGFCNSKEKSNFTFCNINFYNSVFALIACPHRDLVQRES